MTWSRGMFGILYATVLGLQANEICKGSTEQTFYQQFAFTSRLWVLILNTLDPERLTDRGPSVLIVFLMRFKE